MATHDQVEVTIAGHVIKMVATAEEAPLIKKAAAQVSQQIDALSSKANGQMPPLKVAIMVALQNAFDVQTADDHAAEAAKLRAELDRQADAIQRLENLLGKVDDALAY